MGVVLVTGGTRSGKSAVAERLLTGDDVVYLATASATDPEMAARIAAHRERRPARWATIEVGDDPAAALARAGGRAVLLDGLGGWIAGALHRGGAFDGGDLDALARTVRARVDALVTAAAARRARTVIVVEQAGSAPVAPDAPTRRWVDLVGEAARQLAAIAEQAWLVVAGRAVELPAAGPPALRPGEDPPGVARAPNGPAARPLHGDRMVPAGHEDFAVNVLGGGPPEWLARALREALERDAGRYPDERGAAAAVGARHGRPADDVLALNGAAEGFWLLAAALRPRRPVILAPSFTEAATALRAAGCDCELLARGEGFAVRPELVAEDADLVVVANPCNPSGTLHPRETLAALARRGRTLLVDEAFMDLVPGEPGSLAADRDLPGLVVLRSLTKSLGIPGIRAGYLLAAPELVTRLAAGRQPWAVNALALAALRAWAAHPDPVADLARQTADRRGRLERALADVPGLTVHRGAANFLLLGVRDGAQVVAALTERRIAVRPTTDLGLDADHLRVAVRDDAANARLVAALADILASRPLETLP
jgi:histidinol-phosphate/aromatic aminotransferase/cobyric acid decarboxylase-like protein/adenosyl cobinamide kinase/adenosyl cobinamide phosphate guanylyltransferase